jgi:hypothetical protein
MTNAPVTLPCELDKAAGNAPEMVREQIATTGPIAPMLKMMEEQAKKG